MSYCDFKIDLFGRGMTEVFKGFGWGYGAVAVGSATQLLAGVIAWVFGR